MISILDSFFSAKQCIDVISHYERNVHNTFTYQPHNTRPLSLLEYKCPTVSALFDNVDNIVRHYFNNTTLSNVQIVKWVEGSGVDYHLDYGDKVGAFVYLNQDFEGGHTIINETNIVKPQTGKLIFFENGKLIHKVTKVTKGNRFVLAAWYV